jgi:hypothetical protein
MRTRLLILLILLLALFLQPYHVALANTWCSDVDGTIATTTGAVTWRLSAENQPAPFVLYLPIVQTQKVPAPLATSTPTATATPTRTRTPGATASPTGTRTPAATPVPTCHGQSDVIIRRIFYEGVVHWAESDEYAEIFNQGPRAVNLDRWRLNAGDPKQDFVFPDFEMEPGQACRVYTNEIHPQTCGFSFGIRRAIWNNNGDCGYLYDAVGALVSQCCY